MPACFVMLALMALAGLAYPVISIPSHIIHDWNEGWNAYWSDAAFAGLTLYPDPAGLVTNNYPPLSFYAVGLAGRIMGDTILAGRLIALCSFLVVALNIRRWLLIAEAPLGAYIAPLLFICVVAIAAPHYLGMNDPQWLGHALATTGLVLLAKAPRRASAIVGSSILMLAAGWTKHLLIPLPLVTTLWLIGQSRRTAALWIGWSLLFAAVSFFAAWLAFGTAIFENIFSTPREFSIHRLWTRQDTLLPMAPMAVACMLAARRFKTDGSFRFALAYLVASIALGLVTSGGAGLDANRYFDAMIAVSMLTGLVIDRTSASTLSVFGCKTNSAILYTTALTIVTCLLMVNPLLDAARRMTSLREREVEIMVDVAIVRELGEANAICDMPAICYWAGAPFLMDMFNFGQKLSTASLPESACIDPLRNQVYSAIVLDKNHPPRSNRLIASCNDAINLYYTVAATSSSRVFLVAANGRASSATATF